MPALTAATWVCAALLTMAGARKVTRPGATGAALQVARLPSDPRVVRALGVVEVTVGLWVLVLGGSAATLLLAALYAAFAGFAEHQRRRGAGCGCFGTTDAPATRLHVAVNTVAAITAAAAAGMGAAGGAGPAAGSGPPAAGLPATVTAAPLAGSLTVVLLAVAAGVLRLLLSDAPGLAAAVAQVRVERDG